MPVRFILGRAGAGKTRHCLDALLDELALSGETRRLLLIVPEQASFQMERALALASPQHGYWRAEVLSFSRLAHRLLEELGHEPSALRTSARALALRCVVEQDRDVLRVFGTSARTPGFMVQLERLLEELLSENILPEQLLGVLDRLGDPATGRRAETLGGLYQGYLDWLGSERIDALQLLTILRERMDDIPWLGEASVWVDGFAGLTGQELETLVALARTTREVSVTLLLDPQSRAVRNIHKPPDLLNLFNRTETTYQQLVRRMQHEGVELREPLLLNPRVVPRFERSPSLARLEAGLAGQRGEQVRSASVATDRVEKLVTDVRIVVCETHRDELRAAAGYIREQVRCSGGRLRYRDFAVIARDLQPFADTVADIFDEYGVPHFIDRRRSLGVHVLSRFVRAMLEVVASDFATAHMVRLLRCGLLPLTRGQAEQLENMVVAAEVRGWATWQRPHWSFARNLSLDDEEVGTLAAARMEIVEVLEPLVTASRAEEPVSGENWARMLFEVLDRLHVQVRLRQWAAGARQSHDPEVAETHRLAWDTLCAVLEDLHQIAGPRTLTLAEVAAIVGSALDDLTIGLAPPTLDQVLVSSIERSRHPDIKYAWVFGFNEGIFPARPEEDVLPSTVDRRALCDAGLPGPRPRRDDAFAERMLAYIALTRPSHGLVISYARAGDDGEPLNASPLLAELLDLLPGLHVEDDDVTRLPVCMHEFARGYLRCRSAEPRPPVLWRRYKQLRHELGALTGTSDEMARLLRGLGYSNSPAPVPDYAGARDPATGVAWNGSPTELDKYLQCPFQHFSRHGLRIAARRGPKPATMELGVYAHKILSLVTERAIATKEPVGRLDDARWEEFLSEAIDQECVKQEADLAGRRPREAFLYGVLHPLLKELVLAHAGRWRRGTFAPIRTEWPFGYDISEAAQALELVSNAGDRILLHGFIDRVDRGEDQNEKYLLVYDYKSTLQSINKPYLTHYPLQLFVYLLAAEQAYTGDDPTRPAGVLLAPLFPKVSDIEKKAAADWSPDVARMHMYRPRGLFDARIAKLLDRDLGRDASPVVAMKLKKDGYFDKASSRDVVDGEMLAVRLRLAEQTVLFAADGILRGVIDVAPLVENKTLACQNCEFATLCRFDPFFNRPRVAELTLPALGGDKTSDGGGKW